MIEGLQLPNIAELAGFQKLSMIQRFWRQIPDILDQQDPRSYFCLQFLGLRASYRLGFDPKLKDIGRSQCKDYVLHGITQG